MTTIPEPSLNDGTAAVGRESMSMSYADVAEGTGTDHGTSPADRLKSMQGKSTQKTTSTTQDQFKIVRAQTSSPGSDLHERHTSLPASLPNSDVSFQVNDTAANTSKSQRNGGHAPASERQAKPLQSGVERDARAKSVMDVNTSLDKAQDPLVSGRRAGASWQKSKIRWAPLNIPLQRRLQTLTILAHGLSIAGLLALFLFLCAIPLLWPILVPYLIYCLFSQASVNGKLSLRSERLRRSPVWSLFASYFPARLHRSAELEPTRKYIFGYHPHGIISHGAFAAFCTEALGFAQLFPGITNTLLTLDANFRVPLYRDYALAMGLASVSRKSCENLLNKGGPNREGMGRAITIVVGGARESLDAEPSSLRLVLKRRKGFVKLAIRNGADLVPVLGFGENDLYEQFQPDKHPFVHKIQMMVKSAMGFTVPLFHARGIFNYDVGLLPYRRPINVVVGRPIKVEQNRKPDDKIVEELHARYIEELLRLWDENKDQFAKNRTSELEIIE